MTGQIQSQTSPRAMNAAQRFTMTTIKNAPNAARLILSVMRTDP